MFLIVSLVSYSESAQKRQFFGISLFLTDVFFGKEISYLFLLSFVVIWGVILAKIFDRRSNNSFTFTRFYFFYNNHFLIVLRFRDIIVFWSRF